MFDLLDLFLSIRWQDMIDITILTFIIYSLLRMLKGTRTIQILIGFLLVVSFYYISGFLELTGVSWVLNNLFNAIVVVVVILFQSDFRNALAQVGTRPFFRDSRFNQSSGFIDKLFTTCEHLSKTRTGALIVLERDIGLANYYQNAVRIFAEFSPQLMVTIFNTQTPLHDGAVLINKGQQVAFAGCILPLSPNIDFSKTLGTRHRAALGLSEESDAIILVVSEETGIISLAHHGELIRPSNPQFIKEHLQKLLI